MMKDENGNTVPEKEILKEALDHLAEANFFLYDLESAEGIAMACMLNGVIHYGESIYRGLDPRSNDLCQESCDGGDR